MRAFRNDFINYDPDTQRYYTIGPSYQWEVSLSEGVDQWSPLPAVDSYRGYSITIYHNDPTLNTTTLCNNGGSVSLAVVPPTSITASTKNNPAVTFGPGNPITNANTTPVNERDQCFDDSSDLYVGGGGEPPYVLGLLNGLKDGISGDWIVKKDNVAIGWFDMETTAPFIDGDETKPIRVPVPRARLTLDDNRKLVSLEISWWTYDPDSATYVEATDATAVQRLIGGAFHVGINNLGNKNEEKLISNGDPSDPMQTTFTTFANPWIVPTVPETGDYAVGDVRVMYSIARTSLTVDLSAGQ